MPKMVYHEFVARCSYMKDGRWVTEEVELPHYYDEALVEFKRCAEYMEKLYGDSHFWTCTLRSEIGDYFQVFHERMVDGYLNY